MLFEQYRKLRKLSRAQAAQELKTSRITVYRWETGACAPSAKAMQQVHKWSEGAVGAADMLKPFNDRHTAGAA